MWERPVSCGSDWFDIDGPQEIKWHEIGKFLDKYSHEINELVSFQFPVLTKLILSKGPAE